MPAPGTSAKAGAAAESGEPQLPQLPQLPQPPLLLEGAARGIDGELDGESPASEEPGKRRQKRKWCGGAWLQGRDLPVVCEVLGVSSRVRRAAPGLQTQSQHESEERLRSRSRPSHGAAKTAALLTMPDEPMVDSDVVCRGGGALSGCDCGERPPRLPPKAKCASSGRWSDGKRDDGRKRSPRTVSSVGSCSTCVAARGQVGERAGIDSRVCRVCGAGANGPGKRGRSTCVTVRWRCEKKR